MLTFLAFLGVLLTGLVVGLVARGWLLMPADRRRLEAVAADLLAEARIDALTRATLRAMWAAVNENGNHDRDDVRRYSR